MQQGKGLSVIKPRSPFFKLGSGFIYKLGDVAYLDDFGPNQQIRTGGELHTHFELGADAHQ